MNNSAADVVVYNTTLNRLEQENAELKARINSLREALEYLLKYALWGNTHAKAVMEKAFTSTPTQSLAEHDRKVIAEFRAKCEVTEFIDEFSNFNSSFSLCMETCIPPIDNEEK